MSDAYDYTDDRDDDEEDGGFDCGLAEDGQCSMAGSEDCDWECPYSHTAAYVGSDAWSRKHAGVFPLEGCRCSACNEARRETKS